VKPTLAVDTTNFTRAIRELARYSGQSLERVVEFEAAKVLESAAKGTKAAKVTTIRANHSAMKHVTYDVGNGRQKYNLGYRYPDRVWRAIQGKRAEALKRKLAARGLSKRSWQMLASAAGLEITVPGYVAKAVASTGKTYPENAAASRIRDGRKFGIKFENSQPTLAWTGGLRAIRGAIRGREKHFRTNMEKGALFDIRQIAAKYPGMIVT
jgi:hypothetical protein